MLNLSDYNFILPDEQIADEPLKERSGSRMLVVDRSDKSFDDKHFNELPLFLQDGDVLTLNNTKVIPARLFAKTPTGANVEIFLIEQIGGSLWLVLARPAKRLRPGMTVVIGDLLNAEIIEKRDDGKIVIDLGVKDNVYDTLDRIGKTPLPPYIKRAAGQIDTDRERYQTVYASDRGAIAAPTAGLHFTESVLDDISKKGVRVVEVTLHVGYGTFEPVREEDLSKHSVLGERYSLSDDAASELNAAKYEKRRIIAVGTTTTRTLENNFRQYGKFVAGSGIAELTILPGFEFKAIDALITNFHLPKSSLLVLVSTFGGHEFIMKAYSHAVSQNYRFYSYGDCMFII